MGFSEELLTYYCSYGYKDWVYYFLFWMLSGDANELKNPKYHLTFGTFCDN